jgi:hypothetical protein
LYHLLQAEQHTRGDSRAKDFKNFDKDVLVEVPSKESELERR